jgi:3'(2'), 5'-bisphosphate nucleotidase
MREGVAIAEKSGPQDKVTAADLALSKLITEELIERFPDDVVISEEDSHPTECNSKDRIWLVDPIDGTDNYIRNDGQYAVMIGLLEGMTPVFGWVYAPVPDLLYFGGPKFGAWVSRHGAEAYQIDELLPLGSTGTTRVMMGFRDRKNHPWVTELPEVEWVKSGSVGLKVGKILDGAADMFIHLSGKLKVWDTAGPVAIALGAGLEIGRLDVDGLDFPLPNVEHQCSVVIGRTGSLLWSRNTLIRSES